MDTKSFAGTLPDYGAAPAAPELPQYTAQQPAQAQARAPGGWTAPPPELERLISAAAQAEGVDPRALMAMGFNESRWRPDVISGKTKSEVGAAGLFQFMPETAQRFGVDVTDPASSARGAAKYMKHLLNRYGGDYEAAIGAYHAGEGNMDNFLSGKPSGVGPRTKQYVLDAMNNIDRFGAPQSAQAQRQGPMVAYNTTDGTIRTAKGRVSVKDPSMLAAAVQDQSTFSQQAGPGEVLLPAGQFLERAKQGASGYSPLLGSAVDGWQAGWQELGGAVAKGVGADGAAQSMFDAAAENRTRQQGITGLSDLPTSYKDVTLGNFGSYIGATLTQSAPYIAEFIAGGGIGSGAAKLGATKIIGMAAEKKAAQLAAEMIGKGVPQKAAEARARDAVARAIRAEVTKAGAVGAKVGQFAAGYGSGFGDIVGGMREEGADPDYGYAAAGAVPYSLLNFLGLEGMLSKGLGKFATVDMAGTTAGVARRAATGAAKGALKTAPGEIVNEVGQEATNQGGASAVNPERGMFDDKAQNAYLESMFGALASGGAMGGAAGGVRGAMYSAPQGATNKNEPVDMTGNATGNEVLGLPDLKPDMMGLPNLKPDMMGLPNMRPEMAGIEHTMGNQERLVDEGAPSPTQASDADQRAAEIYRQRDAAAQKQAQWAATHQAQPGQTGDMFGGAPAQAALEVDQVAQEVGPSAQELQAQGDLLGQADPNITRPGTLESYEEDVADAVSPHIDSYVKRKITAARRSAIKAGLSPEAIEATVANTQRKAQQDPKHNDKIALAALTLAAGTPQEKAQLAQDLDLLSDGGSAFDKALAQHYISRLEQQQAQEARTRVEASTMPTTKDESLPNSVVKRTTDAADPLAPDTVRGQLPTEFLSAEEARSQRRALGAKRPGAMPQAKQDPDRQARIAAAIAKEEQDAADAQRAEADAQRAADAQRQMEWETADKRTKAVVNKDGTLRGGQSSAAPAPEADSAPDTSRNYSMFDTAGRPTTKARKGAGSVADFAVADAKRAAKAAAGAEKAAADLKKLAAKAKADEIKRKAKETRERRAAEKKAIVAPKPPAPPAPVAGKAAAPVAEKAAAANDPQATISQLAQDIIGGIPETEAVIANLRGLLGQYPDAREQFDKMMGKKSAPAEVDAYVIAKMVVRSLHRKYAGHVEAKYRDQMGMMEMLQDIELDYGRSSKKQDQFAEVMKAALPIIQKWGRANKAEGAVDLDHLRTLAGKVQSGLGVQMVDANSNVPSWMKADIDAGNSGAFYFDDEGQPHIVVFTQNIKDEADMLRTIVHEGVGHYGVFNLLGDKVDSVLEGIYRSNPQFKSVADTMIAAGYPRDVALHEAIAALSEQATALKGWAKLVARVRDVLRSVLGNTVAWSDNDVASLIDRAGSAPMRITTGEGKYNRTAAEVTKALQGSIKAQAGAAKDSIYTKGVNFLKTKAQLVRDNRHLFEDGTMHTNPLDDFSRARDHGESMINEVSAEAHPIITSIQSLGKEAYHQLGAFTNKSTALRADPRLKYEQQEWLATGDEFADPVPRKLFNELVAEWDALSPEQRQAYEDTVAQFSSWKSRLLKAMHQSVLFAEGKNAKATKHAKMTLDNAFNKIKGPYAPLYRTGEYLVIAQKGDDKAAYHVASFVSLAEANEYADELVSAGATDYHNKHHQYAAGDVQVTAAVNVDKNNSIFKFSAGSFGEVMDVVDNMPHANDADKATREYMRSAIVNIYTSALPGARTAERHFLNHRKGVAGASTDMPRAVADTSQSLAYLISRISTEQDVQSAMYKMREMARQPGATRMQRTMVYNALQDQLERQRTPSSTAFSRAMGKFGFMWYLGFTPSFVALQAVQTPMLTLPVLAKRHGYANAANTLMQAAKDAAGTVAKLAKAELSQRSISKLSATPFAQYLDDMERAKGLRGDNVFSAELGRSENGERSMLLAAYRRGLINVTMAYDVDAVASGDSLAMRGAMRAASWASQQAEMFNRVTTALAAYRLATSDAVSQQAAKDATDSMAQRIKEEVLRRVRLDKGFSDLDEQAQADRVAAAQAEALATLERQSLHNTAVNAALDALDMSQFDYSGANKPRFLSGAHMGYIGPALMFKSFAQHMLYLLLSNAKNAVGPLPKTPAAGETREDFDKRVAGAKLERAAARKFLAGVLATHTAVAGLSGGMFPGMWTLANALSGLWDDDGDGLDEDAQTQLYALLNNSFGKTFADVAMYGAPRLVGVDIGSRTGLSTLNLLPQAPINDGREGAREWITNALGPVVSGAVNAWSGWDLIGKGDTTKGLSMMLPKFLGDPIRAYRLNDTGLATGTGLTAVAPDQFNFSSKLLQAIGFTPAEQQDYYRGRKVQAEAKAQMASETDAIKRDYHKAMLAGDQAGVREATKRATEYSRGKQPDDQLTVKKLTAFHKRRLTEQGKYSEDRFAEDSPTVDTKLDTFR